MALRDNLPGLTIEWAGMTCQVEEFQHIRLNYPVNRAEFVCTGTLTDANDDPVAGLSEVRFGAGLSCVIDPYTTIELTDVALRPVGDIYEVTFSAPLDLVEAMLGGPQ